MTADPTPDKSTAEILGAYRKELEQQGFDYEQISDLVRHASLELLRGDAQLVVKFG